MHALDSAGQNNNKEFVVNPKNYTLSQKFKVDNPEYHAITIAN